jgi:CRISPR/Cas system CMR-associated protein Cmr5 small subunit
MVEHPEFKKSKRDKVRTPMEDSVGTVRALGPKILKPRNGDAGGNDFANAFLYVARSAGQSPYDWPGPDGYPETNPPWSSAGRVLDSMGLHRGLTAGYYPSEGVEYRAYTEWLPGLPASFKKVINHASGLLHGRKAPKNVRKAISIRTGIKSKTSVTSEQMTEIVVQQILLTLLDSPTQLKR